MQPGNYPPGPPPSGPQYPPPGGGWSGGVPPAAPPPAKSGGGGGCLKVLAILAGAAIVLGGVFLAIAVPAFNRYLRRAKAGEAVANIAYLCRGAATYYTEYRQLPPSAPRTPAQIPGAQRVIDPPGIWAAPPWSALAFQPPEPHYFSYELVNEGALLRVRAYGDLDGDGEVSMYERTVTVTPMGAVCNPQMNTVNDLE